MLYKTNFQKQLFLGNYYKFALHLARKRSQQDCKNDCFRELFCSHFGQDGINFRLGASPEKSSGMKSVILKCAMAFWTHTPLLAWKGVFGMHWTWKQEVLLSSLLHENRCVVSTSSISSGGLSLRKSETGWTPSRRVLLHMPSSVSFVVLSSSYLCAKGELTKFFAWLTEFAAELGEFSLLKHCS